MTSKKLVKEIRNVNRHSIDILGSMAVNYKIDLSKINTIKVIGLLNEINGTLCKKMDIDILHNIHNNCLSIQEYIKNNQPKKLIEQHTELLDTLRELKVYEEDTSKKEKEVEDNSNEEEEEIDIDAALKTAVNVVEITRDELIALLTGGENVSKS